MTGKGQYNDRTLFVCSHRRETWLIRQLKADINTLMNIIGRALTRNLKLAASVALPVPSLE